ncbi:Toxin CSTX-10 like [Heracleum sosnowskyi]|uniref:Toxin CSTX-10 like n=1 Tax=Heracleum sosnowskyi TaxID=360622 RepID=A0AAD8M4C3_9APIA|nr:Toxin CSTX-10 like [Heracleum sosnowskyi]
MEANVCDGNYLDADVLLPPRKRLLAGLKKQNFDGSSHVPSTSVISGQFDILLSNLLESHMNKSPEEIMVDSRSAVETANKVAKATRAVAESKAEVAAKAMVAAKSALDLLATMSEISSREKYLRKNKIKTQVPVDILYNKNLRVEHDAELARDLHRAINSSTRTVKTCSIPNLKSVEQKRLVKSLSSQKLKYNNRGHSPHASNGNGQTDKLYSDDSSQGAYDYRIDEKISKLDKADQSKITNRVSSFCGEKMKEAVEDPVSSGRKRGRIRQKKLPLSVCNFRDQENPKEQLKPRSEALSDGNVNKDTAGNDHLVSVGPAGGSAMSFDRPATWKCKEFKGPAIIKQNKVTQL